MAEHTTLDGGEEAMAHLCRRYVAATYSMK
jgi:hypothetical protein